LPWRNTSTGYLGIWGVFCLEYCLELYAQNEEVASGGKGRFLGGCFVSGMRFDMLEFEEKLTKIDI